VFTGIVEAIGRIEALDRSREGARLRIAAPFASELEAGESVAVNGCCLTVARVLEDAFEADAVARTLGLTTLGRFARGAGVNLERAVRAGDRLGGHLVTGHIDGVGTVERMARSGGGAELVVAVPAGLAPDVVPRGSVALDGVSLTVAGVAGARLTVSLIPETLGATIASTYRRGTGVNVETDLLAKYARSGRGAAAGVTMERLKELGFVE
jgi:riboflavin synthase